MMLHRSRQRRRSLAVAVLSTMSVLAAGSLAEVGAVGAGAPPPGAAPRPATSPQAPAPATHPVRLTRPFTVGQKQLVVGSLVSDDRTSGGGKGAEKSRHETGTIRFVVVAEATVVSPRGNVQRATLTIRRLFKDSGGGEVELAKPGDELRAYLSGRRHIVESRGAEMAPDLMEALGAAAALRADDDPTDDDLFGTAERRAAGASWPINTAVFARSGAQQLLFEPGNVSGTVTLAALPVVKGVPCEEVRWKVEARRGSFKSGALPAGLLGTMDVLTISGRVVVPLDAELQPVVRESEIGGGGDFTGSTDSGDPLTLHRQLRQTLHLEISPLR